MRLFKTIAGAWLGAGLAAAAGIAHSADLAPIAADYAAAPAYDGWYIRGDVGYAFDSRSDGVFDVYGDDRYPYDLLSLKWQGDFSAGLGYRLGRHLRGDLTVGYWSRGVEGRAFLPWTDESWSFDDDAGLKAWELLANAYADLKSFGRVTPYLGGGLGVSFLNYGQLTNRASCVGAACDPDYTGYHPGLSSARFTWALMAGATIDLTDRAKLDFGYRYVHVDGGRAFGWDQFDAAAGATGTQTWDGGFSVHQLRIGARYAFN